MQTQAKLNERLTFSAPATWVPMALFDQVVAEGRVAVTSPPTNVTVQLRKATSAAGANAANLGSAVVAATQAVAQAYAADLGTHSSGAAFTHVSATITGAGSPAAASEGVVVRGAGRFNP